MAALEFLVTAALTLIASGATHAALHNRGGGMIYDDVMNITWLSDWNYSKTQFVTTGGAEGDEDGRMFWAEAMAWADSLVYGGYSDWRLPDASDRATGQPRYGYNVGGEYGHMFYANWGALEGQPFSSGTNTSNLGLFTNVQSGDYWSGQDLYACPCYAWVFRTFNGLQHFADKGGPGYGNRFYAIAVRHGDVAPVPEPKSVAMLALGLALLGLVYRRSQR